MRAGKKHRQRIDAREFDPKRAVELGSHICRLTLELHHGRNPLSRVFLHQLTSLWHFLTNCAPLGRAFARSRTEDGSSFPAASDADRACMESFPMQ